jgi:ATP-binding cassette subfamily B protein
MKHVSEGGVLRRGAHVLSVSVREQPRLYAYAAGGSLVYGGMIVAQSYVLGAVTGHVITPALRQHHTTAAALWISVLAIVATAGVKVTGIFGRRLGAGAMQYALQADYRRRVTRRYLTLPMSWHAARPTGVLLNNANSDVEAAWYPIAAFPFASGVVVIMVVVIVALLLTSLPLALVGCLVFPAVIAVNAFYARDMSPKVSRSQQLRAEVSGIAHESFDGALVVKTLGREDTETERFSSRVHELRDALITVGRLRGTFDPLLEAIPNLGVLAVLLVGAGRVGTATLVQVAYLFTLLAFPLRSIGWLLAEIPRSVNGWDRVQVVLRETAGMSYGTGTVEATTAGARLTVTGVDFAYDGHAPVLRGVDLDLRPGRTVAVVGTTGAGKSTLASLLVRLIDPAAGSIELDGTDLRELGRGAVAEHVALVAQQTFVFDDTVRGNVTLGAEHSDDEGWAALRLARADDFVARIDDGLDAMLGERGTTLSGGQRQRLALARALVRKPRLLVLDDATSAVDTAVERAILDGLRDETDATTLVVAYRKATIALADEVLWLEDGRIADRGSHADLLERHPGYAAIVSAYDVPAEA